MYNPTPVRPLELFSAIFVVAGIRILKMHEIANGYWPEAEEYAKLRAENPWYLAQTDIGMISIGWRKRVISINWEDIQDLRLVVTEDDVTKNETMVHAWNPVDATMYLSALAKPLKELIHESVKLTAIPVPNTPEMFHVSDGSIISRNVRGTTTYSRITKIYTWTMYDKNAGYIDEAEQLDDLLHKYHIELSKKVEE